MVVAVVAAAAEVVAEVEVEVEAEVEVEVEVGAEEIHHAKAPDSPDGRSCPGQAPAP